MVCFRNDLNVQNFEYPEPIILKKHVEDLLLPDDVPEIQDLYIDRDDIELRDGYDKHDPSSHTIRIGNVNKGGQGERIYSTKGIGITLSAYGGGVFAKTGGYLTQKGIRKLHPRECARLMGYPDTYKIHPKKIQAYKQFGNSVVVDVLQYVGIKIGEALKDASK